jgi:hypothetical protein
MSPEESSEINPTQIREFTKEQILRAKEEDFKHEAEIMLQDYGDPDDRELWRQAIDRAYKSYISSSTEIRVCEFDVAANFEAEAKRLKAAEYKGFKLSDVVACTNGWMDNGQEEWRFTIRKDGADFIDIGEGYSSVKTKKGWVRPKPPKGWPADTIVALETRLFIPKGFVYADSGFGINLNEEEAESYLIQCGFLKTNLGVC